MCAITIEYDWYNPRSPKCRNCSFWQGEDLDYYGDCTNDLFKGNKLRSHNAKACIQFKYENRQNHRLEGK